MASSDAFIVDRLRFTVACDLDGVLVDSTAALTAAYARAGVVHQPNRPWREWCTPEQYATKTFYYATELNRRGRLTNFATKVYRPEWLILTGASQIALQTVKDVFGLRAFVALCGLSVADKIRIISKYGIEVYYDDDPAAVEQIGEATKCQTFLTRPR